MTPVRYEIAAEVFQNEQPEAAFRAVLLDAIRHHGWTVLLAIPDGAYRVLGEASRSPRHGHSVSRAVAALAGWPDLHIGHPIDARNLWVEIKTDTGKPTAKQRATIGTLAACGADVRIWRPRHWDEEIEPTLRGEWVAPNAETERIVAANWP